MRVLIIIGAGASFDSWPQHINKPPHIQQLPLANELFSSKPIQDKFLQNYKLVGLAGILRGKVDVYKKLNKRFDIEAELDEISSTADKISDRDRLQDLFTARFYLHSLISRLTATTLSHTWSHTVYIDFLNQLKKWIDIDPNNHFADIVSFNYDTLLENGMSNVYPNSWSAKSRDNPLRAYLLGNNLKIYKPHGSINWVREIPPITYTNPGEIFDKFDQIEPNYNFKTIDPNDFLRTHDKFYIPAIAVPFKSKEHFEECPQDMQVGMLEAITNADKIITLGWRGADKHFTDLLKSNGKTIDEVHVVSPSGDTDLDRIYSMGQVKSIKSTFSRFICEDRALGSLLQSFSSRTNKHPNTV